MQWIGQLPNFSNLTDIERHRMARAMVPMRCRAGYHLTIEGRIVGENDPGDMYFIYRGSCGVTRAWTREELEAQEAERRAARASRRARQHKPRREPEGSEYPSEVSSDSDSSISGSSTGESPSSSPAASMFGHAVVKSVVANTYHVPKTHKLLATLPVNAYFGERAPNGRRRNANVVAQTECVIFAMSRPNQDIFFSSAVSEEMEALSALRRSCTCPAGHRSELDIDRLEELAKGIEFCQALSKGALRHLCQMMTYKSYKAGKKIFELGKPGFALYIILNGTVDLTVSEVLGVETEKRGNLRSKKLNLKKAIKITIRRKENLLDTLERGDAFGEMALVERDHRRPYTATAKEATEVMVITADQYDMALSTDGAMHLRDKVSFLTSLPLLTSPDVADTLTREKLIRLSCFVQEQRVQRGAVVLRERQASPGVFIVVDGSIAVMAAVPGIKKHMQRRPDRAPLPTHVEVARVGPGEMFGWDPASLSSRRDTATPSKFTFQAAGPASLIFVRRDLFDKSIPVEAKRKMWRSEADKEKFRLRRSRSLIRTLSGKPLGWDPSAAVKDAHAGLEAAPAKRLPSPLPASALGQNILRLTATSVKYSRQDQLAPSPLRPAYADTVSNRETRETWKTLFGRVQEAHDATEPAKGGHSNPEDSQAITSEEDESVEPAVVAAERWQTTRNRPSSSPAHQSSGGRIRERQRIVHGARSDPHSRESKADMSAVRPEAAEVKSLARASSTLGTFLGYRPRRVSGVTHTRQQQHGPPPTTQLIARIVEEESAKAERRPQKPRVPSWLRHSRNLAAWKKAQRTTEASLSRGGDFSVQRSHGIVDGFVTDGMHSPRSGVQRSFSSSSLGIDRRFSSYVRPQSALDHGRARAADGSEVISPSAAVLSHDNQYFLTRKSSSHSRRGSWSHAAAQGRPSHGPPGSGHCDPLAHETAREQGTVPMPSFPPGVHSAVGYAPMQRVSDIAREARSHYTNPHAAGYDERATQDEALRRRPSSATRRPGLLLPMSAEPAAAASLVVGQAAAPSRSRRSSRASNAAGDPHSAAATATAAALMQQKPGELYVPATTPKAAPRGKAGPRPARRPRQQKVEDFSAWDSEGGDDDGDSSMAIDPHAM